MYYIFFKSLYIKDFFLHYNFYNVQYKCTRISRENFHINCTWKEFHVKIVWKSCDLSHEIHVKLFPLHTNFTLILDKTSPEIHVKLFSCEFHLSHNLLCKKSQQLVLLHSNDTETYTYNSLPIYGLVYISMY